METLAITSPEVDKCNDPHWPKFNNGKKGVGGGSSDRGREGEKGVKQLGCGVRCGGGMQ